MGAAKRLPLTRPTATAATRAAAPASATAESFGRGNGSMAKLFRKAKGGTCSECEGELHRKAGRGPDPGEVPPLVSDVLRSPGQPLDKGLRADMEARFGGEDFSGVRVHTDSRAAESAEAVNAKAYTVGQDVVFGAGSYPGTGAESSHLIAHELTHVIQQTRGPVDGKPIGGGLRISRPDDRFEQEAEDVARRVTARPPQAMPGDPAPVSARSAFGAIALQTLQRQPAATASREADSATPAISWATGPLFGPAIELPGEEAAVRVNEALDILAPHLTYIRRPPASPVMVAEADGGEGDTLQTSPATTIQREAAGSSFLAKVHGGVVGSLQLCLDVMTGEWSIKGWIWAGVGYEVPVVGWVGGYFFGEQTWAIGKISPLMQPSECDPKCAGEEKKGLEFGGGIAGFPIDIRPNTNARLGRAGFEFGFLFTPHSLCDADLEVIALINLLPMLGPVATVATKAVDALNALARGAAHFEMQAGIDISATLHLCWGGGMYGINHADVCGGGYVGAGVGLSHNKAGNHGAT